MANSNSDDATLDFDSFFKGCIGLGHSTADDPTANDPKKKKRKSVPLAISLPAEDLLVAECLGQEVSP